MDWPGRLSDGAVALRELVADDVEPYARAFAEDRDMGRLVGFARDPEEDGLRAHLLRLPELAAEDRFHELAIEADGRFAGSLVVHHLDRANGHVEVGFWLLPDARGRGVATTALRLALGWLFEGEDLNRVEMTTTPDNPTVPAVAERLGFTREGVLRSRNLERGQFVDVVWFGLLRSEWPR
jgi:RimJ/RimL family protein N-acetyltransferase